MNEFIPSVQTDVDTLIENKVAEYRIYARKTAENILEMSRVIFEAKNALKQKSDFQRFCSKLGVEGSTTRKLMVIGSKYELLNEKKDSLPSNWTVIYEITQLSKEVVDEFVEQGVINQGVTSKQIKEAVTKTVHNKDQVDNESKPESEVNKPEKVIIDEPKAELYTFTCEIEESGFTAIEERLREIIGEMKKLKVNVQFSDSLKQKMED